MSTNYTRDEEEGLARSLARGEPPVCPRCQGSLAVQPVPPKEGVPYVRTRVWLTCGGCGRSVVLDRRRIERYR